MTFNEETYELIQRYLNEEMSSEELKKFQEAVAANPSLAREVELHAEMRALLKDSPENRLRHKLKNISDQITDTPPVKSSRLLYLLWFIPVLLLVAFWWVNPFQSGMGKEEVKMPIKESQENLIEPKEQVPTTIKQEEEAPSEIKKMPPVAQQDEEPKPIKRTKPKQEAQLLAANFEPNPALEFLIDNNTRSNDIHVEVPKNQKDVKLIAQDENINFQFRATFNTTQNLLDKPFKLHLFTNNPTDFDDFTPLKTISLSLKKGADDTTYKVTVQELIQLQAGLYYQVLEDMDEERIYWVGRLSVSGK